MQPTVHHVLQAARPLGLPATDIAEMAGLSIEDTYAELVRLEALGAVDIDSVRVCERTPERPAWRVRRRHVWSARRQPLETV